VPLPSAPASLTSFARSLAAISRASASLFVRRPARALPGGAGPPPRRRFVTAAAASLHWHVSAAHSPLLQSRRSGGRVPRRAEAAVAGVARGARVFFTVGGATGFHSRRRVRLRIFHRGGGGGTVFSVGSGFSGSGILGLLGLSLCLRVSLFISFPAPSSRRSSGWRSQPQSATSAHTRRAGDIGRGAAAERSAARPSQNRWGAAASPRPVGSVGPPHGAPAVAAPRHRGPALPAGGLPSADRQRRDTAPRRRETGSAGARAARARNQNRGSNAGENPRCGLA
jgi:hypothetical protein